MRDRRPSVVLATCSMCKGHACVLSRSPQERRSHSLALKQWSLLNRHLFRSLLNTHFLYNCEFYQPVTVIGEYIKVLFSLNSSHYQVINCELGLNLENCLSDIGNAALKAAVVVTACVA